MSKLACVPLSSVSSPCTYCDMRGVGVNVKASSDSSSSLPVKRVGGRGVRRGGRGASGAEGDGWTCLMSPLSDRNSSTRFGSRAGAYSYTVPGDSVSIWHT